MLRFTLVSLACAAFLVPAVASADPGHTLYVVFDGGEIAPDCSDPEQDCTDIPWIAGKTVEPFSGDVERQDAIADAVAGALARYDIAVVTDRPDRSVDYDTVMVGDVVLENLPSHAMSVATLDCGDEAGAQIGFVLGSDLFESDDAIAKEILLTAATTWGLEFVDDPEDVMFPLLSGNFPSHEFQSSCADIVDGSGNPFSQSACGDYAVHCDAGQQNSHLRLLDVLGPGESYGVPSVNTVPSEVHDGGDEDEAVGCSVASTAGGSGWAVLGLLGLLGLRRRR